ncbi:uncharacterized protein LOC116036801 isoform X3 [Sander lucioperca]|uniref:uncharacterized protein LOC116036801 isoform X3 n=1 Tax=Sander lucioperca TaxID=283035 RepID=UPI00125DB52A|nr:uncharacterized protein LOC116036801 isoform X3 [Sander lucioperca]
MGSAAVCGENMKNVNEQRGLKRVKCPDRNENIMYGSLLVASKRSCRRTQRKQCIESEEHFHFLRDRAERATSKASQKDKRGMSMWPMYRTNWHDISVKKADVVDVAPRRSLDSLDNDSSSGESELFICL